VLRLFAFIAGGVLAGAILVSIIAPEDAEGGLIGIAATGLIIGFVGTSLGRGTRGMLAPSQEAVQTARDARRLGLARVDALRQTGTQINDQPVCEIDVTVRPLGGEPFATTITKVVPIVEIPAFQAGSEHEVLILLDGGPETMFLSGGDLSPSERRVLTVPSRDAVPVRLVAPHTRIVRGRRRGPLIGIGRRSRPWRIAAFLLAGIIAATVVVLPYREAVAQTIASIGDGRLRPDARRPEVVRDALAAITTEIGHEQVVSIGVYEDFVIVDAPLRVGDTRTDEWMYRSGRVSHRGAASSQPDSAAEQFSISEVSVERIWPLLQRASQTTGTTIGDANVRIARTSDGDVDSPTFGQPTGAPEISFGIGDDYGDTWFVAAADGSGLRQR
jgi:hypothetical protein